MTDKNSPKNNETISVFLNVFLIVIWSFWFSVLCLWFLSQNIEIDKVGDAFNILWAVTWTIAVVLVYLTYKTQKEELSLTRQELKNSAEMMRQQKEIMDEEKKRNYIEFLLNQKRELGKDFTVEDHEYITHQWITFFSYARLLLMNRIVFQQVSVLVYPEQQKKLYLFYLANNVKFKKYKKLLDILSVELNKVDSYSNIHDCFVLEDEIFFFEHVEEWSNFVYENFFRNKK